jgi:hypothetical protein
VERYMMHLENGGYSRTDASGILRRARALAGHSVTVRDVRVAAAHVELDTTIPDGALPGTLEALGPLGGVVDARLIVEAEVPKDDAIREGIDYFNRERFWECHESFEGVWKGCYEGEKDLVQGIILAAAGLVHYQKNEDAICLSIFGRALHKLAHCSGTYHTIDVELLRRRLDDMVSSGRISTFELA